MLSGLASDLRTVFASKARQGSGELINDCLAGQVSAFRTLSWKQLLK